MSLRNGICVTTVFRYRIYLLERVIARAFSPSPSNAVNTSPVPPLLSGSLAVSGLQAPKNFPSTLTEVANREL